MPSERQELVACARQEGANITMVCEQFRISRKTGYKWLARAAASAIGELERFAAWPRTDLAAVQAGLTLRQSNGQTEGHVTKPRQIKRQGYGRASVDLLRKRLLLAA